MDGLIGYDEIKKMNNIKDMNNDNKSKSDLEVSCHDVLENINKFLGKQMKLRKEKIKNINDEFNENILKIQFDIDKLDDELDKLECKKRKLIMDIDVKVTIGSYKLSFDQFINEFSDFNKMYVAEYANLSNGSNFVTFEIENGKKVKYIITPYTAQLPFQSKKQVTKFLYEFKPFVKFISYIDELDVYVMEVYVKYDDNLDEPLSKYTILNSDEYVIIR